MQYFQKDPSTELSSIIKSFWQIEDLDNTQIIRDKIVPDGYPELIFHYGDPYKIDISGKWEIQAKELLAGQLTNFFHLENTGAIGMFAIKLQPWAPSLLSKHRLSELVDAAVSISDADTSIVTLLMEIAKPSNSFEQKCEKASKVFLNYTQTTNFEQNGIRAIKEIIDSKGKYQISEICSKVNISERSLERFCKENIGLSPKFYSRIIRLAYIFKLVNEDNNNWAQLSYLGGFYDQAHFIKDFKKFTGEEPTKYGFNEKNMANFFLK
ncbi:MAG: helix-turn-helix transcriptional regulator [bacterium]|nr:helix-turn-helix transcriptional regulator [bacterium]